MPAGVIEYDDEVWTIDAANTEFVRLYSAAGNPSAPVVVAREAIDAVNEGDGQW